MKWLALIKVGIIPLVYTSPISVSSCSNNNNNVKNNFFEFIWDDVNIGYLIITNFSNSIYDQTKFNLHFSIPLTYNNLPVIGIGDDFLSGCTSFNQPLIIPSSITSIGDNFLYGCLSFNQSLTIPSSITSIGKSFMYSNDSYTSSITIDCDINCFTTDEKTLATENIDANSYKNGISIFINDAYKKEFDEKFPSYFSPIYLRNLILMESFLEYEKNDLGGYIVKTNFSNSIYDQTKFNLHFSIPLTYNNLPVNGIGDDFLSGCTSFNQPLTIPNTITSIGKSFLNDCWSFDNTLLIPNDVQIIEDNFLNNCSVFNTEFHISNQVIKIPNNFLSGCTSFNQPLIIPNSATSIGDNFLYGCLSFNQSLTIPSSITSIGNNFMQENDSYTNILYFDCSPNVFPINNNAFLTHNQNAKCYTLGININSTKQFLPDFFAIIPADFNNGSEYRHLIYCNFLTFRFLPSDNSYEILTDFTNSNYDITSFNLPFHFPTIYNGSPVNIIGDNFLSGCTSFNQSIIFPNTITSIGNNFLSGCTSFNQKIIIQDAITSIGDNFLSRCASFNESITINECVTSIGSDFLSGCTNFNQPLRIPNSITSITKGFLSGCTNFNQPLTIPSNITSIDDDFLSGCTNFNQPLTIPDLIASIPNGFLSGCTNFNQPLTIPNTIESIGNDFLSNCTAFDSDIGISDIATSIGKNFLYGCISFNKEILLRAGFGYFDKLKLSIGDNFMYNCKNFASDIKMWCSYSENADEAHFSKSIYSFSVDNKNCSAYSNGIKITIIDGQNFGSDFPNRDTFPYRNLIITVV